MLDVFDPVFLSRVQFAFVISFHIIFPSITIGLASWLMVVEWLWLKTGNHVYRSIYKFWTKVFAITFGMGVVSGVVMSYQFGTNWAVFSDKVGNVIGPLLGFEVMTAFFLESSFLGVMLFGWGRVSDKMHFVATCMVAVGTLVSAFWILSASSWMHTPTGFRVDEDGLFYATNWLEVIFNPSFLYRFIHMVLASYIATAFFVGGVSAWYLLKRHCVSQAKVMFIMAMFMAIFVVPAQMFIGDMHGLEVLRYQPVKIAAMEGIWETEKGAPFTIIGVPNNKEQKIDYALKIPKAASLVLTHDLDGEVKGLNEWSEDERPPVATVFYSFRIMIGLGVLMLITGIVALWLFFRGKLFTCRCFHWLCIMMAPSGLMAILAGWFVTEVGRQPYIVYGLLKTSDAISPVEGGVVAISLAIYGIVYSIVFGFGLYYILRLVRLGCREELLDSGNESKSGMSVLVNLFTKHGDNNEGQ